ncbi:MAG: extracellular solute-binding protein [Dehalococcoidia bacterium]
MDRHVEGAALSRRSLLALASGLTSVGLLAACGAASATSVTATTSGAATTAATGSLATTKAVPTTSAGTSSSASATGAANPTPTIPAGLQPATFGGSGGPHLQVWWPNGSKDLSLDASAQAFLKTQPTWSIELTYTNGVPKFLAAVAADTPPDVYLHTTDQMLQFAAKGILVPLDDYIAQDKVDMKQYFKAASLDLTYKNKTYGMPEHLDVGSIYQNDRLLQTVGMDPSKGPQSWDDLVTINQHVTQKNGQSLSRVGFIPTWGWPVDTVGWLQANGAAILNADGSKVAFNTAAGSEALNWVATQIKTLGGMDAITPFQKPFKQGSGDALAHDALATELMGVWDIGYTILKIAPNLALSQWSMPGGPSIPGQQLDFFIAELIFIPTGSKQHDDAWQFVKWHSGPGGQQFIQTVPGAWDIACIPAVAGDPASIKAQPWRTQANALMAKAETSAAILSPAGDDMQAAMNKVAANLWAGKQDVSTTMTQMAQQAQAVLDQYATKA